MTNTTIFKACEWEANMKFGDGFLEWCKRHNSKRRAEKLRIVPALVISIWKARLWCYILVGSIIFFEDHAYLMVTVSNGGMSVTSWTSSITPVVVCGP